MNTTDSLLASLRDIHEPAMPAAPALWPLIVCAIICAVCLLLITRKLWLLPREARNRQRFATLEQFRHRPLPTALPHFSLWLRNELYRHTGQLDDLLTYGEPWLQRLDQQYNTSYFTTGNGRVFGTSLYQMGPTAVLPGTGSGAAQAPEAPPVTDSDQLAYELKRLVSRNTPC